MSDEKVRENLARRMLARRGFWLRKSRRRDPQAIDFGGFMIVDLASKAVVAGGSPRVFSMSLEDVETWLGPSSQKVFRPRRLRPSRKAKRNGGSS